MIGSANFMQPQAGANVTELLIAWSGGDSGALEKLTPLVYEQLHRSARRYMAAERPGHPLQATALVNEAYLRLADAQRMDWQSRAHFFAVSAQLMRRILVDFARSRKSEKHGGNLHHTALDEALMVGGHPDSDLVALDDALTALGAMDPRKAKVVEMRFFGGLSEQEIGQVLKISVDTVQRDWKSSRAWLYAELRRGA
ncbi:MAG TPA: sigma-70 family RNA polymerase sigma factor [Bryobacteraceae bacterium]